MLLVTLLTNNIKVPSTGSRWHFRIYITKLLL